MGCTHDSHIKCPECLVIAIEMPQEPNTTTASPAQQICDPDILAEERHLGDLLATTLNAIQPLIKGHDAQELAAYAVRIYRQQREARP
jgi:hypothetical protein